MILTTTKTKTKTKTVILISTDSTRPLPAPTRPAHCQMEEQDCDGNTVGRLMWITQGGGGGVGIQWELPIFWNTVHGSFPEQNCALSTGKSIILVDLGHHHGGLSDPGDHHDHLSDHHDHLIVIILIILVIQPVVGNHLIIRWWWSWSLNHFPLSDGSMDVATG